jgi:hypothetical protein
MDCFHCELCNITFKSKRCLTAHKKTQRHMKHVTKEIGTRYKCMCGKSYAHRQSLFNHSKTCTHAKVEDKKEKEDDDVVLLKSTTEDENESLKQELQKQHEEEIEELKQEIERLKAEKSVINNNQNIETQNNINIHLNAYGKENLDYITDTVMLRCINHITRSIPMLVSKIHFDPKHPENHNIKITNHRLPYVKILNKKKQWEYANREQTMVNVICKSYSMLETTYEGYKDEIPESTQKHFENFQNKYNENDDKTMKNLNQHVEMIMMNGH